MEGTGKPACPAFSPNNGLLMRGWVINAEVLMSQQEGPMGARLSPSTWPFSLASLNKERQESPGTRTDLELVVCKSEEEQNLSSNKTSAVALHLRRRQFWLS